MVGRRPDYYVDYTIGMLHAIKIKVYMNAGASPFDPSPLFHIDGHVVYSIPNFSAEFVLCKTNIPSMTSVRGPGWIPANFITEHIVEHAASFLGVAPHDFKRKNFFTKGQVTPDGTKLLYWNMDTIFDQLRQTSDYDKRYQDIIQYNKQNKWTKRGISITPSRFGVQWQTNHFSALVNIYGDGSVVVTHAGVEVGQGIDTKVTQAVAYGLGITMDQISIATHDSTILPNVTPTGGSITSALCCMAAMEACDTLNARLAPIKANLGPSWTWPQLISVALSAGVDLQARGNVFPANAPNSPNWQYQSYCCCVQEVFVDILTGEHQLLRTDILYDAGVSLNPTVDIGQVEGAFVMGLGLFLTEEIEYNPDGMPRQYNTWEYKPLSAFDIPLDFRVALLKDAPNPVGFLSSKCVGEPPLSLGCAALFAIQHAVADYRQSSGKDTKNFSINSPASPTRVFTSAEVNPTELIF